MNEFEQKYSIDYTNLAVFYYRGTDKRVETNLCDYDSYITKAKEIAQSNTNIQFLIVSDEIELINLFKNYVILLMKK